VQVQARARCPGRSPGVSVHQETRVGGRGGVSREAPAGARAARIIIITDELRVWRRRRRSVARASSLGRRAARRSRRDDAVSIDTRLSTSVRRDTKTTLGCHADLWTSEVFPPSPKRRARKKRGRLESGKKRLVSRRPRRSRAPNAATARDHRFWAASVARTRDAPGSRRRDARGRREDGGRARRFVRDADARKHPRRRISSRARVGKKCRRSGTGVVSGSRTEQNSNETRAGAFCCRCRVRPVPDEAHQHSRAHGHTRTHHGVHRRRVVFRGRREVRAQWRDEQYHPQVRPSPSRRESTPRASSSRARSPRF